MEFDLKALSQACVDIAKEAGKIILAIYNSDKDLKIKIKDDETPVTRADIAAHEHIAKALKQLTPNIPILSEEAANIDFSVRKQWQTYWLIDPLDGTKEFINGTDEFTVNIALIHNGHSILGVIDAPVLRACYFAYKGAGAYKIEEDKTQQIHCVKVSDSPLRVTVSRRHNVQRSEAFMKKIPTHTKIPRGSSLKTCTIAEGLADAYPCFGKTSEWDMGAAQCIIEEAGGAMTTLDFQPIRFNQKESLLNPPLLVVGDRDYNWRQYL